ncbi:MAG: DUF1593 domain-containing protein [Mariniphaga sp.]|nr:DUF1593 domain-containing protein [Mariniphaga sp.]MDD4425041.1 DUF1593 domain-containing protein [Mariniphaga sp.]
MKNFLKLLSVGLIIFSFSCNNEVSQEKPRVIILTDMTHDDGNSFIRYLYYAPWFDLEALIVTNQLPDFNYDDNDPWGKAMGILDAYKQELPQLRKHDPGFPDYEELMAVTKRGRGSIPIIWLTNSLEFKGHIADRYAESSWDSIYFHDWIGEGLNPNGEPKDSEGSEFLQQVFDKDDDRPIYVQAWGGPITFIQALYRYKQRKGAEEFEKLLSKLHVYGILFQDITFDYLIDLQKVKDLNCTNFGTATFTYEGERGAPRWLLHDSGHFWRYVGGSDPVMRRSEVNGHGPMSNLYDNGGEGDTPAFLYLLSSVLGLNNPEDPTQGSWGNMFYPMGNDFPEGYYHTCFHEKDELVRWIPDVKKSYLNRLQWSVKEPDEVNHAPFAIVNNNKTNRILTIQAKPGEKIKLDASKSFDPDGNDIRFNWFRYKAADSFQGELEISSPENAMQTVMVPSNLAGQEIHLVLEVRDNGTPDLVSYRRVIIKNKDDA